jgi:hypothetical protein
MGNSKSHQPKCKNSRPESYCFYTVGEYEQHVYLTFEEGHLNLAKGQGNAVLAK